MTIANGGILFVIGTIMCFCTMVINTISVREECEKQAQIEKYIAIQQEIIESTRDGFTTGMKVAGKIDENLKGANSDFLNVFGFLPYPEGTRQYRSPDGVIWISFDGVVVRFEIGSEHHYSDLARPSNPIGDK